jgi:hypothetical protein
MWLKAGGRVAQEGFSKEIRDNSFSADELRRAVRGAGAEAEIREEIPSLKDLRLASNPQRRSTQRVADSNSEELRQEAKSER